MGSSCCCLFKKKPRHTFHMPLIETGSTKHLQVTEETYIEIEDKVRQFIPMTAEDILIIKDFPENKMFRLIQFYNIHVTNIRPIIDDPRK